MCFKNKIFPYLETSKKSQFREFHGGIVLKDPTLSLLWCKFSPWSGNFCMLGVTKRKKKVNADPSVALGKRHYLKMAIVSQDMETTQMSIDR